MPYIPIDKSRGFTAHFGKQNKCLAIRVPGGTVGDI